VALGEGMDSGPAWHLAPPGFTQARQGLYQQ